MTDKEALEFASRHGIAVTIDKSRWVQNDGKPYRELNFRVGRYNVKRPVGSKAYWTIDGITPGIDYTRGNAIEKCVKLMLESQSSL